VSYFGRLALEHIDSLHKEGQRVGKIHPWERSEILGGNWGPIIRELEPDFSEGQEFVLSWTRAAKQAVYDDRRELTGEVIRVGRLPLFVITIRDVKRHRAGYFRVRFDILDRREQKRLVRRKPPALREGEYAEATEAEVLQAAVESAYTGNPKQALDHLEAVPADWQNVLSMQATSRFAEHQRSERAEQESARDLQRLNAELRELAKRAAKMGVDPVQVLAPVAREISTQHASLKDAA
jgi:hypothetical protein